MSDHTEPMEIPAWLVIDAARYALGRTSYQVDTTARWLVANWLRLPEHARQIIRRDVEEAFERDDRHRADGGERPYRPLGHDCDRASWQTVRDLWKDAPDPDDRNGHEGWRWFE